MHEYLQKEEKESAGMKSSSVQRKSLSEEKRNSGAGNRTGIPTQLKERMEQHTGLSLDDVRVHYHSDLPARLDSLAYTQGNQVYIGAGQERHLPHELGHVVQQKLGKVRADTRHESGVLMNTDAKLEREADEIGALRGALQGGLHEGKNGNSYDGDDCVQRKISHETSPNSGRQRSHKNFDNTRSLASAVTETSAPSPASEGVDNAKIADSSSSSELHSDPKRPPSKIKSGPGARNAATGHS